MTWSQAKNHIVQRMKVGTDLNTLISSHRVILSIHNDISSNRYGYKKADGFKVQIGTNNSTYIYVPFGMLKSCFGALSTRTGYDGKYFRSHFPKQAADHPCHVHVVGKILVKAGLAKRHGNSYR